MSQNADWKKQIPMWLTWGRIAICVPLALAMLLMDRAVGSYVAASLFVLAAITDWYDGYLARLYNAQSTLGKFMDPIADKILVSTVLILLVPSGEIHPVLVILLLSRDILIGGIRAVAAADRVIIDAKATGKWKTGIQMIAIPAVLLAIPAPFREGISSADLGRFLLWISTVLSLVSGWEYIQIYQRAKDAVKSSE